MNVRFDDRCVIVTGAGNGLGRAYAHEFARRGANVVVNDPGMAIDGSGTDTSVADRVVAEIVDLGGRAAPSYDSVATPEGGASIVSGALEAFGRLDAVVNNAGNRRPSPFEDMTAENFQSVVATHLMGAFYVSQPAYREMLRTGYGRFVFISSNAGLLGNPNLGNYAAAKAGALGLANVIALEGAAHNILANTLLPMAPTPRALEGHGKQTAVPAEGHDGESGDHRTYDASGLPITRPEEMAPLVVALASEACTCTHQIYSYGYGRLAAAFIGLTRGWYPTDVGAVTPEDILERLPQIDDREGYAVPMSLQDEKRIIGELAPTRD